MKFIYRNLSAQQIPEPSEIGYLIGVEADLEIMVGSQIVLSEPAFPVLELAWSLEHWLAHVPPHDFVLKLMDYEKPGVVSIQQTDDGWVVSSCFNPLAAGAPCDWETLVTAITGFIDDLHAALLTVEPRAAQLIRPARRTHRAHDTGSAPGESR